MDYTRNYSRIYYIYYYNSNCIFKYSIDEMRYYNEWIEFFGDIWFGIIILPVTHLFDEDNKI